MDEYSRQLLSEIKSVFPTNKLFAQDFLQTWDKSLDELKTVVLTAELLQHLYGQGKSLKVWDGGLAVANFRDKEFDEQKSQVSHGETVRETAVMLSFCAEVLGIRDDIFVGEGHTYQEEVARALQAGYADKVLHQRTTVINLQCDRDHPTQSLADLVHLKQFFGGSFQGLKDKKITVSWAYSPSYGKPLSVPQGLIGLLTYFGMDVTLAHPEGYDLLPDIVDIAKKNSEKHGGKFRIVHDMKEACKDAQVVYAKSWGSLALMNLRTSLLKSGKANQEALRAMELKSIEESEKLKSTWEYNEHVQQVTRDGKAIYMHCLPADISGENCQFGEVSKEVFAANRNLMYKEARNKPFVIASMMLLSRVPAPLPLLEMLGTRSNTRLVTPSQ